MADEVWVEHEHFRQLLTDLALGNEPAAMHTLDLHPELLNERWEGALFDINNDRYIAGGSTALLAACMGGDLLLVMELLLRGADWNVRDDSDCDALWIASWQGHVAIATILLRLRLFFDPNTTNDYITALGVAAANDRLPVCILLLSKGADLYALMADGHTALQWYGDSVDPPLTPAVLEERLALLKHSYDEGPHPNACWARRWPFMQVMVFNDFQPLLARQLVLLALNPPLPPDASIPPIIISTVAQRRAFLNMAVFGHGYLWMIIASYI